MGRTILALSMLVVVTGCGRERRATDEDRPAPPTSVAAPIDAAPVRGGPDDPLAEKLRHCPVAVAGASTVPRDQPEGVALTIIAVDDAAAAEIRRRTAHLVELSAGQAARTEHGGGAGGGFMQNCPVVIRSTSISAVDVAGGTRLLMRPLAPLTVADLRAEVGRRLTAFAPSAPR